VAAEQQQPSDQRKDLSITQPEDAQAEQNKLEPPAPKGTTGDLLAPQPPNAEAAQAQPPSSTAEQRLPPVPPPPQVPSTNLPPTNPQPPLSLQDKYMLSIQQQIQLKGHELEEVKAKISELNGKTDIKELSQIREVVEAVREKEQEAKEERDRELERAKARQEAEQAAQRAEGEDHLLREGQEADA